MSFEGKVVVVTGAAQSIGKQIALDFAKQKARLVILDVNPQSLILAQSVTAKEFRESILLKQSITELTPLSISR